MMSASPEFYKPSSAPAFSPPLLFATVGEGAEDYYCRTPTGAGISYLGEPDACPPAPRKPRPPPAACRKRLFEAVSLRLDDLERIFQCDKRRRSPDSKAARTTSDELISNPPVVSRH